MGDWYADRHRQFLGDIPPLLAEVALPGVIADVGCGDGTVLEMLRQRGVLTAAYAIDPSETRVKRAEQIPGVTGVVADGTAIPLPDGSVDGVVCLSVIEHVPDQAALVGEIARILRPGGWWYIGSCIRGPHAWWIYRRGGRSWLDPTHVREYGSEAEFRAAVSHESLGIELLESFPLTFAASDLVMRAVRSDGSVYARHPRTQRLRSVRITVPGYRTVEAAGRRR